MKTIEDLSRLIDQEAMSIAALDNEKRGGATREQWADRQKAIRKMRGKHTEEIKRLRRLILFVERTPMEGVKFMHDKLVREIASATGTAHRMFDPKGIGGGKNQIKEYLSDSKIPLKKQQTEELKFLLT